MQDRILIQAAKNSAARINSETMRYNYNLWW